MSVETGKWTIIGQGLAGTCLAWELWRRGVKFTLTDRGHGGSSRAAAGMINPITGKNFEPSWRIEDFLPDALELYAAVEKIVGQPLWFPLPVLRLAESEKEWVKIISKFANPAVQPWLVGEEVPPAGWAGAVILHGGGRLDVAAFIALSREFFQAEGCFEIAEISNPTPHSIWCEGAVGLMVGKYGPHRCAKGEILTVKAAWEESQIRVGAGGWLVPVGDGHFKAGSTYEWNDLDDMPTEIGKQRVEMILEKLGGSDYQIVAHDAAIRPILRRSQPLIGPLADSGGWMFNALGSKGSLYAPAMATRLARWMLDGIPPEPELDFRVFLEQDLTA